MITPDSPDRLYSTRLRTAVVLFALTAREHGAPLYAPADPSSDYPARPEWYFLSLFQLPDHAPGWKPVGSLIALAVVGTAIGQLVLFRMLPYLDPNPRSGV